MWKQLNANILALLIGHAGDVASFSSTMSLNEMCKGWIIVNTLRIANCFYPSTITEDYHQISGR